VSSRKEQKEALRREREERERAAKAAERRKRLVGLGLGGALALAALVAIVVVLVAGGGDGGGGGGEANLLPDGGSVPDQKVEDLQPAARAAGCELKSFKGKSRDHTEDPNERVKYESEPPTSGRHFVEWAEDPAAHSESPSKERLVHALEHGRVIVWYKPSLPEDVRADLKALYDADNYQQIFTPNREMPYAVAATAWNGDPQPNGTGRLLGCKRMNDGVFDAIRTFRDEHRGNGPEPVP
jgi:Protein of unknown function (DUF3105)